MNSSEMRTKEKKFREKLGVKVTLTHFVLKVMAETMKELPGIMIFKITDVMIYRC